jgi:hypothetical protein
MDTAIHVPETAGGLSGSLRFGAWIDAPSREHMEEHPVAALWLRAEGSTKSFRWVAEGPRAQSRRDAHRAARRECRSGPVDKRSRRGCMPPVVSSLSCASCVATGTLLRPLAR